MSEEIIITAVALAGYENAHTGKLDMTPETRKDLEETLADFGMILVTMD